MRRIRNLTELFEETGGRRVPRWYFFPVLGVVVVVFFGVVHQVEFLSDDWGFLFKAALGWPHVLEPPPSNHYNPVFLAYLRFLYLLFGKNPVPMSVMAVVLHALNAYLLFRLAQRLYCTAIESVAIALVYATHFLMFETVFWITCSGSLLMVTFYLATVRSFIWAGDPGASSLRYLAPFAFSTLCLYTMESGLSVFFLCIAIDAFRRFQANSSAGLPAPGKWLYGPAFRAVVFGAIVLSMLAVKLTSGGRFTLEEGIQFKRIPALLVNYSLFTWIPSQGLAALLTSGFRNSTSVPLSNLLEASPASLAAYLLVFVVGPTVLILWRGAAVHKFGLLWFFLVAGFMSLGTSNIAPRYFVVVGLPAAWLMVTCASSLVGRVARPLGSRWGRWVERAALAGVIALVVVSGARNNLSMSRTYVEATQATKSALNSRVLHHALRHPSYEPVVILNLPDTYPAERRGLNYAYLFRYENTFALAMAMRHRDDWGVRAPDIAVGKLAGMKGYDNVWRMYPDYTEKRVRSMINAGRVVLLAELKQAKVDFVRLRYDDALVMDRDYGRKPLDELTNMERLVLKIQKMNREEVRAYLRQLDPRDRSGVISLWNRTYPNEAPLPE